MTILLEQFHLKTNPFAQYFAENEPEIDRYFVRPPYHSTIQTRGIACQSFILFGDRGAGKSASRLAFYKHAWAQVEEGHSAPLVVTLDDFPRIVASGLAQVNTAHFVNEIGYLVVQQILFWLSSLDAEDRKMRLETMTEDEERLTVALVKRFYLSSTDSLRSATVRPALELLNQSLPKRTAIWLERKWGAVIDLVTALAASFVKKKTDVDLAAAASPIKSLIEAPDSKLGEAHFARAALERLVDLARAFGFSGVSVLVDKADETPATTGSAKATAQVLYPLLATTQLLEVDGLGFLLFLWSKVKETYSGAEYPVRLDKIAHAEISWNDGYLRSLVDERLKFFSGGEVPNFRGICAESVRSPDTLLGKAVEFSMKSPRALIRLMDTVFREYDEYYSGRPPVRGLTEEAFEAALDKYAVETVKSAYPKLVLQRILRLGQVTFVNRDLQATFRIGEANARNRITAMVDAGIVALTGTRAAEGGLGGKPAYEYSLVDQRLRRVIDRGISLGAEFDLEEAEEPVDDLAKPGSGQAT